MILMLTNGFSATGLQDIALVTFSGLACLYCAVLSRRLKNLHDLKSGVGASIVELTEALQNAVRISKDNQSSTLEMMTTLRHLTASAEGVITKLEARTIEAERKIVRAETARDSVSSTIKTAKATSKTMLKIVSAMAAQNANYEDAKSTNAPAAIKAAITNESVSTHGQQSTRDLHLKVVSKS